MSQKTRSGLLMDPVQEQAAQEMRWKAQNIPGWAPATAALQSEGLYNHQRPAFDDRELVQSIVNESLFPPANG